MLLAANESFQDAEHDLKVLTGVEVGHSTHHRQVQKVDLSPPNIKQKLTEVCIDGGKVRLRAQEKGQPGYWKEYKTGRLQGIYYGAFFQDNFSLINWVNTQNLARTVYCLGDGHDGVWNLFASLTSSELSKYKHLGKAGTQDHIDAVMSVFRRSIVDEIQKIIHSLDNCLLDITSGSEQEEGKPQD